MGPTRLVHFLNSLVSRHSATLHRSPRASNEITYLLNLPGPSNFAVPCRAERIGTRNFPSNELRPLIISLYPESDSGSNAKTHEGTTKYIQTTRREGSHTMRILNKLKKTLTKPRLPDGHMHTRAQWNEEFKAGDWDFLETSIAELGHYSAVAAYFQHFTPGGRSLDVGCGQGVLTRYLRPHGYSDYLGIDISEAAIRKASDHADQRTRFITADVEEFLPPSNYDCVIFNECLYYLKHPLATVQRYSQRLAENGCFIISMYGEKPPVQRLWQLLDSRYQASDKIQVKHVPSGTFWNVALYARENVIGPLQ